MSKRNLINLILFATIIILVAFIVYEPGIETPVTPPKLTNLKPSDVNHIKITRTISRANEQNIVFVKKPTGWMMRQPYQLSANTFRIESILKLLETVSFSKNNLDTLNKSTFGLDRPPITISFNNQVHMIFGHNKSLKNHRYVQINSTLHMIADTFTYQLSAKSESYINHKLLPDKSKIIKLTLPGITFEKNEAKWKVTPVAGDITADSINQLIDEWKLSQAYDIQVEKIKIKSKPDITILLENKKTLQFKISTRKDKFILHNINSGVQYIMSSDRKDKLLKLSAVNQDD